MKVVDEVRVHTVGGGAGDVEEPDFVVVLVSKNGTDFHCAGTLGHVQAEATSGRSGSRVPYTYRIKGLETEARFVRILLQPGSVYVFLDEIEVLGPSEFDSADRQVSLSPPIVADRPTLLARAEEQAQFAENLAALRQTMLNPNGMGPLLPDRCKTRIAELQERAFGNSNRLHPAAALHDFHRELALIRAELYQQRYPRPYVCLAADPFENIQESQIHVDPVAEVVDSLHLDLWENEFESTAINIINCSLQDQTMQVSLSSPAGQDNPLEQRFQVRRGLFVQAREQGAIADALVLQQEKAFVLEPGQTAPLWLEFNSSQLEPGQYQALLKVSGSQADGTKLPDTIIEIDIDVAPLRLPDNLALDTCTWAYLQQSAITQDVIAQAAQDLKAHYTNVCVVPPADIPFPPVHSNRIDRAPDRSFARTDAAIQAHDYARIYLFYFAFRPDRKDSGRFGKWMNSGWKAAFHTWLTGWVAHLKEIGIGYERFALYPFDEQLGDELYQLAQVIKSIDPRIRIYANSFGQGPADFVRFEKLIDIWCFTLPQCQQHTGWLKKVKGFGKIVWLYQAKGPGKANDPHGYYRLLPWWAFRYGLTGVGFWTYVDPGAQQWVWDDTASTLGYYGVVYSAGSSPVDTAGESIIPSRRWQAWREGIEDYVYLSQWQRAIADMRSSAPQLAREMERTLEKGVARVLADAHQPTSLLPVRQEITRSLLRLKQRP